MQPYPQALDLVWPGHLHGTGCLSAQAMDTGFPTAVWRLCLGPGCAWVWVSVTQPVLAWVLGGCVWVRFVVLPLLSPLGFAVFAVGVGFRPAPLLSWPGLWDVRGCVCAPPAPCRSRFWCTVWACVLGSGFWLRPASPWEGVAGVCVRACAPLAPALPGGALVARGCVGVAVGGVCPPHSPFVFSFWCRSLIVPVLGLMVSVPPFLLFRAVLFGVYVFFFAWCVSACFGFLFSRWAAALSLVLPVLAGWSPGGPLGGPVFAAVCMGGLAASCGVGGRRGGCGPFSPPPPCYFSFSFGGVCLFLPPPSLGWRTHWLAFCVVFRFAVGGCVVPGRAPAPSVGWVMYTLGSALLPAGLGSGSAGWAVVAGGFVWPWVSRVPSSLRCRL